MFGELTAAWKAATDGWLWLFTSLQSSVLGNLLFAGGGSCCTGRMCTLSATQPLVRALGVLHLAVVMSTAASTSISSTSTSTSSSRVIRGRYVDVGPIAETKCVVTDFGAKGYGKSDDTVHVQAAFDHCGQSGVARSSSQRRRHSSSSRSTLQHPTKSFISRRGHDCWGRTTSRPGATLPSTATDRR